MAAKTRYAQNDGVNIAYQVLGDGPIDLVLVPGFVSHLESGWADAVAQDFLRRLTSFARVIMFDKPGTGMSDPVIGVPTLEQRMEDLHAVLDAVDSDHCVLYGWSEGGPMSILFAATYPERVTSMILYGSFAKGVAGDGYPIGLNVDDPRFEAMIENWGDGDMIDLFAPSWAHDPVRRRQSGLFERTAASPGMVDALIDAVLQIDVREVARLVNKPTLILHRPGDLVVDIAHGRFLAETIPGARLVELPGDDHIPWLQDSGEHGAEIEEFVTGVREAREPDRVLATVLFTDICDSTRMAAEFGDARWRELLLRHDAVSESQINRFRGRRVKSTGDGVFATFDGPARAIRCATDMQSELAEAGIPVRAGVHTGECELIGDDIGGMGVHIGARVAAQAGAGELFVSSTVKDLVVGAGFAFEDRGSAELKGVPGEWRLYAVADSESDRNAPVEFAVPKPNVMDRGVLTLARRAPGVMRLATRVATRTERH